MEAYSEACGEDPYLQSFDDKCRCCFDTVMRANGDGHGGIQVGQLKELVSFVCEMNNSITHTMMTYEDEIVELMVGEEECLKIVEQYFSTTSEMLAFCCELERFVVSTRTSHSYITHVIQKLQTEYGINDDDNGTAKGIGHYMYNYIVVMLKSIISSLDYFGDNMISRNRFTRIVEVLENLKGSGMLSRSDSAASLLRSIEQLQKKLDDLFEALKRYDLKLQNKLQSTRNWKRITNIIFISTMVFVAVSLSLVVAWQFASPNLLNLEVAELGARPVVTMSSGIPETIVGSATVLNSSSSIVEKGKHWINSLFEQKEAKITNQLVKVDLMKDGAKVAIKELGDIEHLIDSLLVHVDLILKVGNFGEVDNVSFATKEIKDDLGVFLEKIEALEKEQKRCTLEIRKARDDVLAKITRKVQGVKNGKGKQA